MVEIDLSKENIVKFGLPTAAGAGGFLFAPSGLEILFVVVFVGLSFVPYRRLLGKELTLLSPVRLPVVSTRGIPDALSPDSDWWRAIIDVANCAGKRCDICSHYRELADIKCAKVATLITRTPLGGISYEEGLVLVSSQISSLATLIAENNALRRREEARNLPINKILALMATGIILLLIQQGLPYLWSLIP